MAFQISEQVEALGSGIGVKCGEFAARRITQWMHVERVVLVVVVGGIDMMTQAIMLAKKPHVVIGKAIVAYLVEFVLRA